MVSGGVGTALGVSVLILRKRLVGKINLDVQKCSRISVRMYQACWDHRRVLGPVLPGCSHCTFLSRGWSQRGCVSHLERDGGSLQHTGPGPEAGGSNRQWWVLFMVPRVKKP
jgi:hypothetical protein